jgi:hypothetical protein
VAALELWYLQLWLEGCSDRSPFDMLVAITRHLEGHNVEYFVNYGTLLGAVRNQSIIPWTMDVDICIPSISDVDVEKRLSVRKVLAGLRCYQLEDNSKDFSIMRAYPKTSLVSSYFGYSAYIDMYGEITYCTTKFVSFTPFCQRRRFNVRWSAGQPGRLYRHRERPRVLPRVGEQTVGRNIASLPDQYQWRHHQPPILRSAK